MKETTMSALARFTVRTAFVSATALALTVVTLLHGRTTSRPAAPALPRPLLPPTPPAVPARMPWWTHDWEATAPLLPRG
jgi:hypothetical protein